MFLDAFSLTRQVPMQAAVSRGDGYGTPYVVRAIFGIFMKIRRLPRGKKTHACPDFFSGGEGFFSRSRPHSGGIDQTNDEQDEGG